MGGHQQEKQMKWWQLSLFGVASIIGTGFFLGSSIAIKKGGPAVLITFLLAAYGTYVVFDALAKMTAADPAEGAFKTYAKKAFGNWAGFSIGWVYWCSEMLIMGSQLTALSIFSKFWFPNVPMWLFAIGYAVLGLAVLLIGVNGLNKLESLFAVIKIAAILMFIIVAVVALFGLFGKKPTIAWPTSSRAFFRTELFTLWSSLIFAFYAFGGVEVMGLMATQLKNPKEAPKSGKIMLILLTTVYLISISLAVLMVPLQQFKSDTSPFVTALSKYDLAFVPHLFNGALIIAGFSTMVAALFGVTSMLVSLAKDGDAPALFARGKKLNIPEPALAVTVIGIAISIVLALVMPNTVYEFVTTGAGLLLVYNWLFILLTANRLLAKMKMKLYTGMVVIILAVAGTLFSPSSRPGFFISLGFVGVIGMVTLLKTSRNKKEKEPNMDSLFVKLAFKKK